MKFIVAVAIIAGISAAHAETPLCKRVEDNSLVPCYSADKVVRAVELMKRRGVRVDYVVSIEMNRGAFPNANALADYILSGM